MNSTLHIFGNTRSLQSKSLVVSDIDLLGVNFGSVVERLCEKLTKPFSTKVLASNLLMASTFPLAYPCTNVV